MFIRGLIQNTSFFFHDMQIARQQDPIDGPHIIDIGHSETVVGDQEVLPFAELHERVEKPEEVDLGEQFHVLDNPLEILQSFPSPMPLLRNALKLGRFFF